MPYQFNLYLVPMLVSAVLPAGLVLYVWRRRSVPGAMPLAVFLLCVIFWAVGAILEQAATDVSSKIFWFQFKAQWQLPAVTANFWFALDYVNPSRRLSRRALGLLALPCFLVVALSLTNSLHHWFWIDIQVDDSVHATQGIVIQLLIGYGYVLGLVSMLMFVWLFIRSPLHRMPVVLILCGELAGLGTYLLNLVDLNPIVPMDSNMLGRTCASFVYALAIFRFRMFDVLPVARETVIEQMQEGMMILDSQNHIVDLNPAAEKILGIAASQVRGRQVSEFLNLNSDASPTEITIETSESLRIYSIRVSPIQDRRGLLLGHLYLLHDLTEQKQTQAQLVEQQRALATLEERERLARELHDTLVQATAAIRMQAETTDQLLRQGETALVHTNLTQIADASHAMHLDLREYLFGVSSALMPDQNFFVALRSYLSQFDQRWTLRTQLRVPGELEQQGMGATVEMQLWRIIQEALANVRKHASAQRVDILFEPNTAHLQVVIQDDGCGFDLAQLAGPNARGFGTRSMRERAQSIGGTFRIESTPGKGTRISVQIPVEKHYANPDR